MPIDTSKFKNAPHCTLASLAYVLPMEDGRWQTVNDGGDVNVLEDADFHRRCQVIASAENGEGVYSVIAPTELGVARKYVLNADKTVSLDGFEEPIDLAEFRKMAVRSTADGKVLASLAQTLTDQWNKCTESRVADDHLMDIRMMAEAYIGSEDPYELHDYRMYSLQTGGMTDGLDFMALMAKINAIGHPDGPTHERFPLKEAFEGWQEVRNLPTYMSGGVRFAFDLFMRDMLGEFPDDRVTMVALPKGDDAQFSEKLEEAGFDLVGMLKPFEGGNVLPGYRTNDVAFHRARGVDIVVFSDFAANYAYAWPTEEGGKFEPPALQIGGFKFG
ncbi:hypothetical protein OIU34_18195 [Pararhizobium sp. BT-229]|uniref:hypothetical protein n=1 Tax=Pararhizobium sp. BT-229 TaxID=2986923 RepID=UPI0021F6F4E3|nr:hypothetical protein [Pararhizobium sp. BT-229]MCV9963811.1 hypothetical protein [Pararhizobium sp. BT-229]